MMHPHPYLLFLSLYLAQGLPVGFMTHALPVILRSEGVSLTQIGGFGLLMLPWSIKFFWAPLVDRWGITGLGHYRSWILPVQFLGIACLWALAQIHLAEFSAPSTLMWLFAILMLMNLASATQDVATDGLAVKILVRQQQQWGNSFQVLGSRLGFLIGGGAFLWCLDQWGWAASFYLLAGLVILNSFPILFYQEPKHQTSIQVRPSRAAIRDYFLYFWQQAELRAWLGVLLSFKILDGFTGPVLKPLLVDVGLSLTQIGLYITILGACAALVGAVLMGYLLKKMTRANALITISIVKLVSFFGYVCLAYAFEQGVSIAPWLVYLVNAVEDAVAAMLLVVMLTLIMQYSRKAFAATDFSFQVSILATISGVLYILGGILADQLGYFYYLMSMLVVGIVCLIPLEYWRRQL